VATGHFIGEGFDEPHLDTLFLAMPISWKGTLQQYAGRLHRLYEAKKEVKIYDYVDIQVRMLEKIYQKRLNGYASMGYKAKGEEIDDSPLDIIFNKDSFLPVFKSNSHQKFAVMDQRIVWYGSINLLSYGSAQESIMCIESASIANELLKSIEGIESNGKSSDASTKNIG
jgi:superfamily II DNA or RNA helicase